MTDYLDYCFYCYERKDKIIASQRYKQNIICGLVDRETGELLSEIKGGRHTFAVTDRERKAAAQDEAAIYEDIK